MNIQNNNYPHQSFNFSVNTIPSSRRNTSRRINVIHPSFLTRGDRTSKIIYSCLLTILSVGVTASTIGIFSENKVIKKISVASLLSLTLTSILFSIINCLNQPVAIEENEAEQNEPIDTENVEQNDESAQA